MTGATITVRDEAVIAALARAADFGRDPSPALAAIGEALVGSTKDRFVTGTSPEGVPWAPLNPEYAKEPRRGGPLNKTGELAGHIIYQLGGDRRSVQVGTNRLHARVHQFGATIVPKNAAALVFSLGGRVIHAQSVTVPARPFLGVSADDQEEILGTLADFVADTFEDGPGGAEAS